MKTVEIVLTQKELAMIISGLDAVIFGYSDQKEADSLIEELKLELDTSQLA